MLYVGNDRAHYLFEPLMETTVKMTNGTTEHMMDTLPKRDSVRTALDIVPFAYKVLDKSGDKEVSIWNFERKKLGAYILTSGKVGLKSIEHASVNVYDSYTGQEIRIAQKYLQHEKTENIVWQLHMGQWWGQFGKLSTFLAGIIATSLPITGFLIWWGRRNKSSKKKKEVKSKHKQRASAHHDHAV